MTMTQDVYTHLDDGDDAAARIEADVWPDSEHKAA